MMKKLILLFVVCGSAMFVSCKQNELPQEPEPEQKTEQELLKSLENTTWKGRSYDDGNNKWWWDDTIVFTATNATHTIVTSDGEESTITFPYTYDPPKLMVGGMELGTFENGTMTFIVWMSLDVRRTAKLEKQ